VSIFGEILGGIFKRKQPEVRQTSAPAPQAQPQVQTQFQPAPADAAPQEPVDVAAVLDSMQSMKGTQLNWRTSIVDLMKLLGLESSLEERKALADELGYTGDKSDSASMNIWLHKQVMRKLQDNGGVVPNDLLD